MAQSKKKPAKPRTDEFPKADSAPEAPPKPSDGPEMDPTEKAKILDEIEREDAERVRKTAGVFPSATQPVGGRSAADAKAESAVRRDQAYKDELLKPKVADEMDDLDEPQKFYCIRREQRIGYVPTQTIRNHITGQVMEHVQGLHVQFSGGMFVATKKWHLYCVERFMRKHPGLIQTQEQKDQEAAAVSDMIKSGFVNKKDLEEFMKTRRRSGGRQGVVGSR